MDICSPTMNTESKLWFCCDLRFFTFDLNQITLGNASFRRIVKQFKRIITFQSHKRVRMWGSAFETTRCVSLRTCVTVRALFCYFEIFATIKICIDILILRKYLRFQYVEIVLFLFEAWAVNASSVIKEHSSNDMCTLSLKTSSMFIQWSLRNPTGIWTSSIYLVYLHKHIIHASTHTYIHSEWHSILESRSQIC